MKITLSAVGMKCIYEEMPVDIWGLNYKLVK